MLMFLKSRFNELSVSMARVYTASFTLRTSLCIH